LGVVLYEIVSGHRPFIGRAMSEVTQAIAGGVLHPPSTYNLELSPELERIILKAMARDRNQRYDDAGLMAYELRELHLKPPLQLSAHETSDLSLPASAHVLHTTRERLIIHPPKRP